MTTDQQLQLQALVDGELPEGQAGEVAAWIASNAEAQALFSELKNTRQALREAQPVFPLPESREFYWSKIRRDIQPLEPEIKSARPVSWMDSFRRLLIPASAVAALVVMVMTVWVQASHSPRGAMEISQAGSDPFTYHNYADGTTLVWLSYPAQR